MNGSRDRRRSRGWRPIRTAPRDGTAIWAFAHGRQYVARWSTDFPFGEAYFVDEGSAATVPTHWRPLPADPV